MKRIVAIKIYYDISLIPIRFKLRLDMKKFQD